MESIAKGIGLLLRDPQYSDLEIRCDGSSYFVHRAIVCSRSSVFAEECDGAYKESGDRIIENTVHDAPTLERMLQFIYEGDYMVTALITETAEKHEKDLYEKPDTEQPKCLPPHLRKTVKLRGNEIPHLKTREKASATNPMMAHVRVYGIAEYYGLPELKTLALQKFTDVDEVPSIEDFFQLAKTIYETTSTNEDPLRQDLLSMLLNDYKEWLATETFTQTLANVMELHEFAVMVMSAVFQQSVDEAAKFEELLSTSNLLLSDLDQANEQLAKANSRVKKLEDELGESESKVSSLTFENCKLEDDLVSCHHEKESQVATSNLLLSDLDQANEGLATSSSRVKQLELEHHHSESKVSGLEEKVRSETARANLNLELCNQKDDLLKVETARANRNIEDCNRKDETIQQKNTTIATEKARADRAVAIDRSLYNLVNRICECRHCGEELNFQLQRDDRSGGYPFNSMLRCMECSTKEYGDYIV